MATANNPPSQQPLFRLVSSRPAAPSPERERRPARELQNREAVERCGTLHFAASSLDGGSRRLLGSSCKQRACLKCQRARLGSVIRAEAFSALVAARGLRVYFATFTSLTRISTPEELDEFLGRVRAFLRATTRDGRDFWTGGYVVVEAPTVEDGGLSGMVCRWCQGGPDDACPACEGTGWLPLAHVHVHCIVAADPFSYGYAEKEGLRSAPGGGGAWALAERYGLGRVDFRRSPSLRDGAAYLGKAVKDYAGKAVKDGGAVAAIRQDAYLWGRRSAWAFGAAVGLPVVADSAVACDPERVELDEQGRALVAEAMRHDDAAFPPARLERTSVLQAELTSPVAGVALPVVTRDTVHNVGNAVYVGGTRVAVHDDGDAVGHVDAATAYALADQLVVERGLLRWLSRRVRGAVVGDALDGLTALVGQARCELRAEHVEQVRHAVAALGGFPSDKAPSDAAIRAAGAGWAAWAALELRQGRSIICRTHEKDYCGPSAPIPRDTAPAWGVATGRPGL